MRDLRIFESSGHGKNIKGGKYTSTIQVREHGVIQDAYLLVKQFRFVTSDKTSRDKAIAKAVAWRKANL